MLKIRKIRVFCLFLPLLAFSLAAMEEDMVLHRAADGKALRFESSRSKDESIATTPANDTASALRVAGLWLVILGVIGGALIYMKKRQTLVGAATSTAARLTLVERLPLGPNRELLLIKACDRLLVVSSMANQMALLSDLPSEDSVSQPFAGVLKNREQLAASTTRELRQSPPPRVQYQMPQAQPAATYRPEPRAAAKPDNSMPMVNAWPDLEPAQ